MLPSPIVKRSVVVNGHKTSVSLELAFWVELKAEAALRKRTLGALLSEIRDRERGNLSSACRCHVLAQVREALNRRT